MKHILLLIKAAIITYLLISLATIDLMWCIHSTPWIWIAVIPIFLFLYFLAFIFFHEDMEFEKQTPYINTNALRETIEHQLQEQLPVVFQQLVVRQMAEIRDGIRAVNEEQSRKIVTLSTDIYNVLERRKKILDLEYRAKKHKAALMFLTKRETASLLMVNYAILRKWERQGLLVPVKIISHKVLYRYSDVLKILEGMK